MSNQPTNSIGAQQACYSQPLLSQIPKRTPLWIKVGPLGCIPGPAWVTDGHAVEFISRNGKGLVNYTHYMLAEVPEPPAGPMFVFGFPIKTASMAEMADAIDRGRLIETPGITAYQYGGKVFITRINPTAT